MHVAPSALPLCEGLQLGGLKAFLPVVEKGQMYAQAVAIRAAVSK